MNQLSQQLPLLQSSSFFVYFLYRKYTANPNIIPTAISCQLIFSIFNKVKKILSSFGTKQNQRCILIEREFQMLSYWTYISQF